MFCVNYFTNNPQNKKSVNHAIGSWEFWAKKPSPGTKSNYFSLVVVNPHFIYFFTSQNDKFSNYKIHSIHKVPKKLGNLSLKIEI